MFTGRCLGKAMARHGVGAAAQLPCALGPRHQWQCHPQPAAALGEALYVQTPLFLPGSPCPPAGSQLLLGASLI